MTIEEKIRDEKLKYDIDIEAAKISALSSEKVDKYEYLTGQEILPSKRRHTIEQAKFTYSPLGKALEKQTEKQFDALNSLNLSNKTDELKQVEGIFPKNLLNDLNIYKSRDVIKLKNIIKLIELDYESKLGKIYNFSKYALPIVF